MTAVWSAFAGCTASALLAGAEDRYTAPPMEPLTLLTLAALALIASYVQSVAGFAMGMILMAVGGGFALVSIPVLAATVSLLSLVNVVISVRRHLATVDRSLLGWILAGQVPAIALGLWLLAWLSSGAVSVLQLLLGLFITIGSLSLAIAPKALLERSSATLSFLVGGLGGVIGGLFSASGPVIGWFGYRQPLPFDVIRATLLAVFGLTTVVRTLLVGFSGGLTQPVWVLFATLLPAVVLGSAVGARLRPPLSEDALKRCAFTLLFLIGLWISLRALLAVMAAP